MWVLYVIILIIVLIYVSYYYRYPNNVSILQTTLDDFELKILLEKQPIFIQDRVKSLNQLKTAWFSANITRLVDFTQDKWIRNRNKFLCIQSTSDEDAEILLYPPHLPIIDNEPDINEPLLAIKVKKNQVIIIPLHWRYYIDSNLWDAFSVNDYVSILLP